MKKPENNKENSGRKVETRKLDNFKVKAVRMFDNGNVVADIELNGVLVYGVRVVEGKNGDFLSLPQRKGSNDKYYSIVYWPFDEADQKAIISEIERKLSE